ncbi:MAG: T9SS type A sorting domain-containing protein, partial [Saprospiraceae bacterium]|nr:T9SS type A sorting domain-containing protein [Saprospiraceae bacterium]
VYLDNGQQEILIEEINDSKSGWRSRSEIKVSDFLTPNSNMYLKIVAADQGNVHIYEAGIDAFSVTDSQTTGISNQANKNTARIYPNPFNSIVQLESASGSFDAIEIFDLYGKKIWSMNMSSATRKSVDLDFLLPGLYLVHLKSKNISIAVNKIIKSDR